jgi:hypothetical protein
MKKALCLFIIIVILGGCKNTYKGTVTFKEFDKHFLKQYTDTYRKYKDYISIPYIPIVKTNSSNVCGFKICTTPTVSYKVYKQDFIYLSDMEEVISFKKNDTISLSINLGYGLAMFDICKCNYMLNMYYLTDRCYSYPYSKKHNNLLKPKIKSHKLILMNGNYAVGDTLYGYLEVTTEAYKCNLFNNGQEILKDSIYGYFASIIIDKTDYDKKYNFNKPG